MLASVLNVILTEMSYENWLAFLSQVVILAHENTMTGHMTKKVNVFLFGVVAL
jgi:hypothetical protein